MTMLLTKGLPTAEARSFSGTRGSCALVVQSGRNHVPAGW